MPPEHWAVGGAQGTADGSAKFGPRSADGLFGISKSLLIANGGRGRRHSRREVSSVHLLLMQFPPSPLSHRSGDERGSTHHRQAPRAMVSNLFHTELPYRRSTLHRRI